MSEKKLTAISVAIEVRKLNNNLCHIIDGKESVALIDAYAAQCVKEARERLVAEIKGRYSYWDDEERTKVVAFDDCVIGYLLGWKSHTCLDGSGKRW